MSSVIRGRQVQNKNIMGQTGNTWFHLREKKLQIKKKTNVNRRINNQSERRHRADYGPIRVKGLFVDQSEWTLQSHDEKRKSILHQRHLQTVQQLLQ